MGFFNCTRIRGPTIVGSRLGNLEQHRLKNLEQRVRRWLENPKEHICGKISLFDISCSTFVMSNETIVGFSIQPQIILNLHQQIE